MSDPAYSFLNGKFEGLPPMYISVGSQDMQGNLLTCLEIKDKAHAAGLDYTLDIVPFRNHMPMDAPFNMDWSFVRPEDASCAERVKAYLGKHLDK